MAEKDVIYALELLHTVQIKRECLGFASFVDEKFKNLTKLEKDKLWVKYLNQNKDECQHSYKKVISGDNGMWCTECNKYITTF